MGLDVVKKDLEQKFQLLARAKKTRPTQGFMLGNRGKGDKIG